MNYATIQLLAEVALADIIYKELIAHKHAQMVNIKTVLLEYVNLAIQYV